MVRKDPEEREITSAMARRQALLRRPDLSGNRPRVAALTGRHGRSDNQIGDGRFRSYCRTRKLSCPVPYVALRSPPSSRAVSNTRGTKPVEVIAYNVQAACTALGIGRTHLYQLINDGHLEIRKIGRRTVIPVSSLKRYFDGLPSAASKAAGRP